MEWLESRRSHHCGGKLLSLIVCQYYFLVFSYSLNSVAHRLQISIWNHHMLLNFSSLSIPCFLFLLINKLLGLFFCWRLKTFILTWKGECFNRLKVRFEMQWIMYLSRRFLRLSFSLLYDWKWFWYHSWDIGRLTLYLVFNSFQSAYSLKTKFRINFFGHFTRA